ncbi:MAG: hypothetical protein J6C50_00790 [Rickettsiales bacterium]|nr:hypothetical protein [Rickettsiales bacterium]
MATTILKTTILKTTMLNRLSEAIEDIKEIKSAINNVSIEITRQHHDIYGNGKKGMIKRIEELEDENKNINKRLAYFTGAIAFFTSSINYIIDYFKNH